MRTGQASAVRQQDYQVSQIRCQSATKEEALPGQPQDNRKSKRR